MHHHVLTVLATIAVAIAALAGPASARDFEFEFLPEPPSDDPILDSGRWIHNAVLPSGEHVVGFVREVDRGDRIYWEIVVGDAEATNVAGVAYFDEGSHVGVGLDGFGNQSVFYQDGLSKEAQAITGQLFRSTQSFSQSDAWYPEDVEIEFGGYGSAQYPSSVGNGWNRWMAYFACGIYGQGTAKLYAARPSTGPYETELVDDVTTIFRDRGRITSVDVGPFAEPGIAYLKYDGTIMYAERDGSGWSRDVVFHDQGLRVGHVDLAIDGGGVPHISFYVVDDQDLKYATRDAQGNWSVETAAFNGRVGRWSSIDVDPAGVPHIACRRDTDDALLLVSPAPGGTWDAEVVSTQGDVGEFSSLAIDAYGGIHIAYRDATNERAKVAWWLDTNVNGVHDATDIANGLLTDCDGNGIDDDQELLFGFAEDCNANGIPDKCEEDCDGDGTLDPCQIAADPTLDCDGNGILDVCDIANGTIDCDGDGTPDACEIAAGAADCDGDGALDSCQLAEAFGDCDANGELDLCQVEILATIVGTGEYFDPPQRAGAFVAGGDFNGDGHADLVFSEREEILVHLGGPSFDGVADFALPTYHDAVSVGDVNDDGLDDLLVAESWGWSRDSKLTIYRGDATVILVEDVTMMSPDPDADFGAACALADLDGDGSRELLVGTPEGDLLSSVSYVFAYATDSLDGAPEHTLINHEDNGFGRTLINAGDLDGNGLDDFVVGDPSDADQAYVYFSQAGAAPILGPVINPTDTLAHFSIAMAAAGDVNGDGYADFYVGDPRQYLIEGASGRVLLYHGGDPMNGYRDRVYTERVYGTYMGEAVASGADLNGDGFDDLLIGSTVRSWGERGVVEVHLGGPQSDTTADLRLPDLEIEGGVGQSVAILGDVNDDGIVDFAYGAPLEGDDGVVRVASLLPALFADCDENGVRDACDIAGGSADQNGDGVPDLCQAITGAPTGDTPRVSRILGAQPNPFNPRTTIRFELAEAGLVELTVYDAAGRRIADLLRDRLAAGRHELTWDARAGGTELASGVYFAVLRGAGKQSTSKLVLVR